MRRLTNEEFQARLQEYRVNGQDIYCADVYINSETPLNFYCSQGHSWVAKPNWIFDGQRCPYCSNRRVLIGYNDLWTTHKEIATLLQDSQIGYEHTYGSKYKTYFICPFCGNVIFKSIKDVYNRGLACQRCSDTISYPNKFMRAMLSQLHVENVVYEYSPSWLSPYAFDSCCEFNGCKIVIEADGGVGHGNKVFGSNEIDTMGIERDKIKDQLAQEHGITVIRIDCNYADYNKYQYIKQNILNSELAKIVDFTCVDWDKCHAEALSSLVYKSAEMYNEGLCVGDIAQSLGYSAGTITSWLKQARDIGLCEYSQTEARKRGRKYLYIAVHQYTKDGVFVQAYKCITEASLVMGINATSISRCCRKVKHFHSAGGYLWFYADDPEQPDKTKIV